jgi:cobalamin biosynthesis Mg chelatase CobN
MHKEQGHTVETAVEARAGFRDRPVLVVLAVSVLLICVLFGLVYMGFFGH